jgi:hypothetical protein
MDERSSVADLLRKVNVVSSKLNLDDLMRWARLEMNGYPADAQLPEYRRLQGELKAQHPMHGHWMPVMVVGASPNLTELPTRDSIAQIEDYLANLKDGSLFGAQLPAEASARLTESFPVPIPVHLIVAGSQLLGVLNTVRNKILDWSLELEKRGVLGNDMTFSKEEQMKASTNVYNIGSVAVLGDIHAKNVQVGDHNSILEDLRKLGVGNARLAELKEIFGGLSEADGPDKATWLEKGAKWALAHKSELGLAYEGLRHFFGTSG